MLTIRKPLELKIQSPMLGLRQDMADRMQANYGLMNMPIRKEELLHVTSETPEIYFAEGDNLAIFNNIKSENQQEIRLDVINNLMNRILVSQTENFTYQDTVYISSVLRKLGIRDEKTFMKQVFALQNEHKETKNLLQSYEANQEILKQFFLAQNQIPTSETKKEEQGFEKERRYYMHDEIFQRLETGKIYQDIRMFSKGNRHESKQIYRTELSIGEQATIEQNFLLQDLKQKITKQDAPLYYAHNNQYEYLQEITENIEESLQEQMTAAILLNLVDQSYALRQEQIEENSHYWYSIAGALFQTAENTWKRYESNLHERKFISNDVIQVLDQVNHTKHLENNTIQNIADTYAKLETQVANISQTNRFEVQKQTQITPLEEVNIAGGYYHFSEEELELQHIDINEEIENETTVLTVEQLQEQLNIFNQKNYENYLKMEAITKSKPQIKERKLDRKKAQKDALRALENPTEVLNEYLSTERIDSLTETQKQMESQIYELFSDETKAIFRQVLSQSHSTEETFLQHVMDQPEEVETQSEVFKIVEHRQDENPETLYQEIKSYVEQNEFVQKEAHMLVSNEVEQVIESTKLIHPEQLLEVEEFYQTEIQNNDKEHLTNMQTQEVLKELSNITHADKVLHLSEQIQTETKESVIKARPVISETIHQELAHQKKVFENLQTVNLYEKWTMPADVVWKIEQEEMQLREEQVLLQQDILTKTKENSLADSKLEILQETTRHLEKETLLHPETILETEEIYQERRQEELLHVQETSLVDLQQNVEKQIKLQQAEHRVIQNQTQKQEIFKNIDFVHKIEEQILNEELLEEIRMQKQQINREEHTEQTIFENKTTSSQIVQQSTHQIQTNQLNNIEELVQQSVKKQIGDLSDQVYGKIEKKLQTERKRRGYF